MIRVAQGFLITRWPLPDNKIGTCDEHEKIPIESTDLGMNSDKMKDIEILWFIFNISNIAKSVYVRDFLNALFQLIK